MRYPADQKARARDALLRAGTRSFKTSGFNGVGVDGLAAAAGVTSGAFYSNFPNKKRCSRPSSTRGSVNRSCRKRMRRHDAEGRARLIGFCRNT